MRGRIADILGMIKFSGCVKFVRLNTKRFMALLISASCRRFREVKAARIVQSGGGRSLRQPLPTRTSQASHRLMK
jgi:hypothetical protein